MITTVLLIVVAIAFGVYVSKFPPKKNPCPCDDSNKICMDYNNNKMSELRVDLIHTMVNKYQSNQLAFINNTPFFSTSKKEDAHSIWFDLLTLKKFIYHIEKTSRDIGANIDKTIADTDLGIRIYYSAYPKKEEDWKTKFPDLIDLYSDPDKQSYEHLHTLVMIPTLNIKGKMVDFNPLDDKTYLRGFYDLSGYIVTNNTNIKTTVALTGIAERDPDNATGSQNHGNLIPPADPDSEGF